ncbi:MAG TPA: hypothetical protein VG454_03705 [Gemmatimonadales bacterium]|nr:hypothetical protein [Gemmatimonadales bacterium]
MHPATRVSLLFLIAPLVLAAQQPKTRADTAPATRPAVAHDSVRGAVRAIDMHARTLEVTTGIGFAIRVVKLQVPADVPITDKARGQDAPMKLAELKAGDVVRARFGGRPTGFVAYTIERLGKMSTGVEAKQ